jgi:hypothetical protein
LAGQVAEIAEQRQRLLVACGGRWVVAGELLYGAQLVEGASLTQLFPEVAEQRQRLLQAGSGGSVVPGPPFQNAQLLKGAGLDGPVVGLPGYGQGGLVEGSGLIPVAVDAQEPADRGGDGDRMPGKSAGGSITGCCVQVRALGLQPGSCLLGRGYLRRPRQRLVRRRAAAR